ncbi:MAG: iron ABC transporter permease [Chloroflexi bacterium]|nr:iron ABC transporter permease [Chloroflexota bacterium]
MLVINVAASVQMRLTKEVKLGHLLVVVLLLLVAFQVLYPLGMLFYGSIIDSAPGEQGNFTLQGYIDIFGDPDTPKLLWTTLWLAVVKTILSVGTAILLAWAVARTNMPLARLVEASIILLFLLPGLPKIIAWILLLQPKTGLLNQFFRMILPIGQGGLNIYSYGGIIFVGFLLVTPFLFILILPAFRAMDASLSEQSRVCGASTLHTLLNVEVPLMTPAFLAAIALAFIRMIESFTVEVLLGVPVNIFVLTTKIYQYIVWAEPPKYPPAMALSISLLFASFALVALQWKLMGRREYTTVTGKGFRVARVDLGKMKYGLFSFVALFLLVDLVIPLVMLVWGSFMKIAGVFTPNMYTLAHYQRVLADPALRLSLSNTLVMSVGAASLGMILCAFIAYVVVRTKYFERHALDLIAWLPWSVPAVVMALGFLWAYLFLPLPSGISLYGTLELMILVLMCKSFPIGTKIMSSTMIQIAKELEESSRMLGASWLRTFASIMLPLVLPGFLAGWLLLFTSAVKDVDTVILLYKPTTTVISTVMFGWSAQGRYEEATIIGLIQAAIICLVYPAVILISRWLMPSKVA